MRGEKWERHVTVTRGQGGEEGDRGGAAASVGKYVDEDEPAP